MNERNAGRAGATRRGFLTGTAGLAAAAGSALGGAVPALAKTEPAAPADREPFWGAHQAGIATPSQTHTYFAAFDLTATRRDEIVRVLRAWTAAAARLADGLPMAPFAETEKVYSFDTTTTTTTTASQPVTTTVSASDSGEATGLPPARLTLTFGFGAGLFEKGGKDRYGVAKQRPEALVELPRFAGDQLVEAHSGGDLSVQACADDPQVAFHAVRQLARLAAGVAQLRWAQAGFMPNFGQNERPRNLMGFRDGTVNPSPTDPAVMQQVVWVGNEGPDWLHGGSYVIARRIRIALEHWDRMTVAFQERTFGRHKASGAPLGMKHETDALDLNATDKDGNPIIPQNSHVHLAAAASNGGAQILRRPYSYNNGADFIAERWPPWRQGIEYDAGLFFICYQRDPRTGFIKIFEKMAKLDMLNQFSTHVSSGLFACPSGIARGEFIGQRLFAA
ncbi:MAG: Dyp-type peroxidase [Stellaceae bacterium]